MVFFVVGVVAATMAVSKAHAAGNAVDGRDPGVEHERDFAICIKRLGTKEQTLQFQGASEIFFRQRRSLIRQPGLLRDQRDPALKALSTKRVDCLHGGLTAAYNNY